MAMKIKAEAGAQKLQLLLLRILLKYFGVNMKKYTQKYTEKYTKKGSFLGLADFHYICLQ